MILVELTAAIDALGTLKNFYVSDDNFVTELADTPRHTAFIAGLEDPGTLGIAAFSDGRTAGGTKLETGSIILKNADGTFDSWVNYSFEGRPVTIRTSTPKSVRYPADFPVILVGTVSGIELSWQSLTILLRDQQFIFTRAVQLTRYLGSNIGPVGLEGLPGDLQGKTKPRLYGRVLNVPAPCVNTSKLTYQVNDGPVADIDAVFDRAAPLTKGSDYATSALLTAATVSPATYATCFAEGYFRLGSAPAGQITANVKEGATPADRTAGQILKKLATAAGLTV